METRRPEEGQHEPKMRPTYLTKDKRLGTNVGTVPDTPSLWETIRKDREVENQATRTRTRELGEQGW